MQWVARVVAHLETRENQVISSFSGTAYWPMQKIVGVTVNRSQKLFGIIFAWKCVWKITFGCKKLGKIRALRFYGCATTLVFFIEHLFRYFGNTA